MITDLSLDLVEEILSKVSIKSLKPVKSTCKEWNTLSKDESFTKKHSAKEFPMFLNFDGYRFRKRFSLHRIHSIKDLTCIKEIAKLHIPLDLLKVNQCDGLLLCLAKGEDDSLVVWNPYLAQTRWIRNSKNHKVLVLFDNHLKHEIYDFKLSSWRVLDIINPTNPKRRRKRGVSVKGNSYFVVDGKLLGFDFTRENFGPCMDLPFDSSDKFWDDGIRCSCVRGEQLALLFQKYLYEFVIWITTKIEPDAVSWSSFLKVDMEPFVGADHWLEVQSFFIEKEKKVAVVCGDYDYKDKCYVVGEDGCYQKKKYMKDIVVSYAPSLVQIQ
ncbi:hypothetical protein F2Q70_00027661 [Brassica cretica]|uniref:F-box domain-containing protein n=1 Tax=Brassica cretica TaxID=69181 RepID=A0A8S9LCD7_BRACR|nr:hypothetical protein F2Q70_00027661 [Brassica cretica]